MRNRRYTTPNPSKEYPYKLVSCTNKPLKVEYHGSSFEARGEIVNIVGILEDAGILEKCLEDARQITGKGKS